MESRSGSEVSSLATEAMQFEGTLEASERSAEAELKQRNRRTGMILLGWITALVAASLLVILLRH